MVISGETIEYQITYANKKSLLSLQNIKKPIKFRKISIDFRSVWDNLVSYMKNLVIVKISMNTKKQWISMHRSYRPAAIIFFDSGKVRLDFKNTLQILCLDKTFKNREEFRVFPMKEC